MCRNTDLQCTGWRVRAREWRSRKRMAAVKVRRGGGDDGPDPRVCAAAVRNGTDGRSETDALPGLRPNADCERTAGAADHPEPDDPEPDDGEPASGETDEDDDALLGEPETEVGLRFDLTVPARDAGLRLDRAVSVACSALSRTRLQGLIAAGCVACDGNAVTAAGMRVRVGQVLTVHVPPPVAGLPEAEVLPLVVLYEDDDVIVIDKPAGLVVHPGAGHRSGTLVNGLLAHCAGRLSGIGGVLRPGIVHRLDRDTSGVLVAAKTDRAHRALAEQFAARTIGRQYLTVVWGGPSPHEGEIAGRIGRDPRNRKRMAVLSESGKPAVTRYRVLAGGRWPGPGTGPETPVSLLECRLMTGRTHQIRVHLAAFGHPVVGDAVYGGLRRRDRGGGAGTKESQGGRSLIERQALHADSLEFSHPADGRRMKFSTPIPADMQKLLGSLGIL